MSKETTRAFLQGELDLCSLLQFIENECVLDEEDQNILPDVVVLAKFCGLRSLIAAGIALSWVEQFSGQ